MRGRALVLCSFSFLVACAGQGETANPGSDAGSGSDDPIDQVIAKLGPLPVATPRLDKGTPSAPVADGDYACVDTAVSEVRQYDQLLVQVQTRDVLRPGALLRGDSVYSGELAPITLPRAPLTSSVSADAYVTSSIEEVSSEQDLAVVLGVDAAAPLVASVKAGFDFRDATKRTRYLVKLLQIYSTIDVDPPRLPHELFAPSVTADDVARVVAADNPPVYVSSIGYGRRVIFTLESDLAKDELSAALDFAFKDGAAISGTTSLTHQEVLSHSRITAFILDGDAGETAPVSIGSYDDLKSFVAKDSPATAITYKLSYARDHTPVELSYGADYTEHACSRVMQRVRVVLDNIQCDTDGNEVEISGTVTAVGSTRVSLLDWVSATIPGGATYPSSGMIGEAFLPVTPQPGQALAIETSLDGFGTAVTDTASFESGWRRMLLVHRSSGDQAITLRVSLTPVP